MDDECFLINKGDAAPGQHLTHCSITDMIAVLRSEISKSEAGSLKAKTQINLSRASRDVPSKATWSGVGAASQTTHQEPEWELFADPCA